jgi:intracellular multiplication protein IcmL
MAAAAPARSNMGPSTGGAEMVVHRNKFYVDQFRSAVKLNFVLAAALVLSLCLNGYLAISRPEPRYFATTADGRLFEMAPLDQPNLSHDALFDWASRAAVKPYVFDFKNYREQIQAASKNFTSTGWKDYLDAMQQSNLLQLVTSKQLVVSATPASSPILVNEGTVAGKYAWKVQVPIVVTYSGGSDRTSQNQNLMVTMVIIRVPTIDSPTGIGINQYIVSNR